MKKKYVVYFCLTAFLIVFIYFCGDDSSNETPTTECDVETGLGCNPGELCIDGNCFAPCTIPSDCSRNETCSQGICIIQNNNNNDAGVATEDTATEDTATEDTATEDLILQDSISQDINSDSN